MYNERLDAGYDKDELLHAINVKGRDNARTPMQWSDALNAGFTSGNPWLRVNPNYTDINVKQCLADPDSIFYTYQKLIELRHHNQIVVDGDFQLIEETDAQILAYYRILGDQKWLVVANLTDKEKPFNCHEQYQKVLVENYTTPSNLQNIILKPYQAFVVTIA
jgi:hypothetical protein